MNDIKTLSNFLSAKAEAEEHGISVEVVDERISIKIDEAVYNATQVVEATAYIAGFVKAERNQKHRSARESVYLETA